MTSERGVHLFLFNGKEHGKFKGLEEDQEASRSTGQDEARDSGSFQTSLTMLGSFEGKVFCLHPETLAEF